jgi:hypothetical protein
MFIFRSAFWLAIGFAVVAPHGTDFGATASTLRDQAVQAGIEAGGQIAMTQVTAKALPVLIDLATSTASVTKFQSPVGPAVFPRLRPAALG